MDDTTGLLVNSTLLGISSLGTINYTLLTSNGIIDSNASYLDIRFITHNIIELNYEMISNATLFLSSSNGSAIELIRFNESGRIRLFPINDMLSSRLLSPTISCFGDVVFENLFAGWPFDVYAPSVALNVTGETEFSILSAGMNIEFSGFAINGSVSRSSGNLMANIQRVYVSALGNPIFYILSVVTVTIPVSLWIMYKKYGRNNNRGAEDNI
jgi:hypothetical protein